MNQRILVCLLVSLGALGCSSSEEDVPEVDCSTPPTFSQVTAFTKCTTCHSTARTTPTSRANAPLSWNFDDYASASQDPTELVHEVEDGTMPPAGFQDPTEAEKQQLYEWALCGTPQ